MLEITTHTNRSRTPVPHPYQRSAGAQRPDTPNRSSEAGDRVELSSASDPQNIAKAEQQARISAVRQAIAEDRYMTPEKLDAVVDRLHDVLFGHTKDAA